MVRNLFMHEDQLDDEALKERERRRELVRAEIRARRGTIG